MSELILDLIEAHPSGIIMVRKINRQEGKSDEYVRETIEPGQNISDQPKDIQNFCKLIWTDKIISDWKNKVLTIKFNEL